MAGPAAAAAISSGASLVGGIFGNIARRKESARNRKFQERMRNTQWQAAVADMEAAGINPALAYSQGPAASPGGSMAQQLDVVSPAVSTGLQAARLKEDLGLVKAQKQATLQSGIKTQREARFQEFMNKLWGSFPAAGKFEPGPLWEMHVANAGSAKQLERMRRFEADLLQNMAMVAKTPAGQKAAFLRYLIQSWKGR